MQTAEKRAGSRAILLVIGVVLASAALCACRKPRVLPGAVEASPPNPLAVAIARVEEERGEPTGRMAVVNVPPELKHYSDRRRFLAVQLAEGRKLNYDLPRDFAELVALIRMGQLVEMDQFSDDHLLYGVGEKTTDALFTHYDEATNSDIPLYASFDAFQIDFDRLTVSIDELKSATAELNRQLQGTNRRDKETRRRLLRELTKSKEALAASQEDKKLRAAFYSDPKRLSMLLSEYRALADLASDFGGQTYDLEKAEDRRAMKMRLLSFVRPQARTVLLEIGASYRAKFERPMPITSLVRTGDYQRHLRETNKSAASTAIPPHTTGLAFDIYNYYMCAAEQDYLMEEIARLKAAGRIEALREHRDHIHVFVFPDGAPPDDQSIADAMKGKSVGKRRTRGAKPQTS